MVNGRWITLQSGIDYLPLEAKLFFIAHADYTFGTLTKGI